MKKIPAYQIPFDSKGNQLHYPESYGQNPLEWVDNFQFEDTLTFDSYRRGRSAAYFIFKRSDGTEVIIFLKEMCAVIPRMILGKISGTFTFVKRGENYGCKPISVD